MARVRTIRPDFFRHHDLWTAERESGLPLRLAFAGLWCAADREGRVKWRPLELKLDALPFDDAEFAGGRRVPHASEKFPRGKEKGLSDYVGRWRAASFAVSP